MTNLKLSCLFSFAFCVVVVARGEWISGSYQMPAETNLAAFFKPAPNDGYYGYFPTANAYQEGGYEAWASIFDPTVSGWRPHRRGAGWLSFRNYGTGGLGDSRFRDSARHPLAPVAPLLLYNKHQTRRVNLRKQRSLLRRVFSFHESGE